MIELKIIIPAALMGALLLGMPITAVSIPDS